MNSPASNARTPENEASTILQSGIQTGISAALSGSIVGSFREIVMRHPNRVAVSTPEIQWSYAELNKRSDAIAASIIEHTQSDSPVVALLMGHSPLIIAAILAVLKSGKMYVALDSSEPAPRLRAVLSDSLAALLLTDKSNAMQAWTIASETVQVVQMESEQARAAGTLPEVSPESGAWLMYTSGSTGTPKGVSQNHAGVVHHSEVYRELIQLTPDDRLSLLASCSLAASATTLFAALLNGACLCPFNVRSHGVERLARWMRERNITIHHSVPTVFRHLTLASRGTTQFESVRLVRLGGESMLSNDVQQFRNCFQPECRLMHTFSSTETGLVSSFVVRREFNANEPCVPVGCAVPGTEVSLLNERGESVAEGEEGRIAVRSAHLAQGYWRQPDATAKAFRNNGGDPRMRKFITQDRGRFRSDGLLEHLGRADQQFKIRGQRVNLAEIEAAVLSLDGIKDSAVTAPEENGERRLIAFVVVQPGGGPDAKTCRRLLRMLLPEHMVPGDFIFLDALPQTIGGKVDRRKLPAPERKVAARASRPSRPRDRIEAKLSEIWREVLGLPYVGTTDDFFDLGGTSIHSALVLARIEETFNVALPPSALAEHGTIEELSAAISTRAVEKSDHSLVALRASGSRPPLFLVHNGHGDVTTYGQLARRISDRPVYAFQSIGLDCKRWPLVNVGSMAEAYLKELLSAAEAGPYFLAGSCMGGLIAFEMARRLVVSGKTVGALLLLDCAPPPRRRWASLSAGVIRDGSRFVRWFVLRRLHQLHSPKQKAAYRHFIARMNARAARWYRPRFYAGKLNLFIATEQEPAKRERALEWGRFAREIETIEIASDRSGLFMQPAVDALAEKLEACLEAARASRKIHSPHLS